MTKGAQQQKNHVGGSEMAEQAVLGAVLLRGASALAEVKDILRPSDFAVSFHQHVYSAMLACDRRGDAVDLLTVMEAMKREGAVDDPAALSRLTDGVPNMTNVGHYATIVLDYSVRRGVLRQAQIAQAEILSGGDTGSIIEAVESGLREEAGRRPSRWVQPFEEHLAGVMDEAEARERMEEGSTSGLPSGFGALDAMTGGWSAGDLVIIAGRPSQGKTALACNMATHAALSGRKVAIVSLEMTARALCRRILFSHAGVPERRARQAGLTGDDWAALSVSFTALRKAAIYVDEARGGTVDKIAARCARLKRERGLDMVVVDYLQLVSPSRRSDNRANDVGEVARGLKDIAMQLDVPVLAAAQVNRASTDRTNQRPRLSDLKESGAIEEAADVVAFIHRPEQYKQQAGEVVPREMRGVAEIIISKQRNGPTGIIQLAWRAECVRFDPASTTAGRMPYKDETE